MVVGGAEERLISGSTDEVLRKAAAKGVAVEHVIEGVLLALESELIMQLDVALDAEHG
jgi:hypothetical protein